MIQNTQNTRKKNWIYLAYIAPIGSLLGLVSYYYNSVYGTFTIIAVQYSILLAFSIIMIIFIGLRVYNRPNIDGLKLGTAHAYLTATTTFITATYAAFGIALTILWGNFFTLAIEKDNRPFMNTLKEQGIVLLVIIIISGVTVLYTFILPLLHHINDLEDEKKDEPTDIVD
jgi:fatty acid desaturase